MREENIHWQLEIAYLLIAKSHTPRVVLDVLKNTDERRTIKDKLTFEYSDGEWELVKSKSFTDIMIFYCNTPALYSYYEWIDETEPEPEPTESAQPEPVTHEQFLGAMDYYHYELIVSSDSIIAMQNSYMDKLYAILQ